MRKKLILLSVTLMIGFTFTVSVFASSTMSWDFELYNNPHAETIASSIAQAQAGLEQDPPDPIERFEDRLTLQILSRIQRDIVRAAFGDEVLEVGHYVVGNYTVDVTTDGDLITVIITDTVTGDTTIIAVPYYDYGDYAG